MADIVSERKMIQQEETAADAALTESVLSRLGGGINFINTRHLYTQKFNVNGVYANATPSLGIDGDFTYPFNFEIISVRVKIGNAQGTSGTSEVDLKWRSENSGTYTSIFSTTPKWDSTAAVESTIRNGITATGWTPPVLSKTTFNAYDSIRLDLLTSQLGSPNGFQVTIFVLPIN